MRVGLLIYSSLDSISGGYLYDRQLVEYLRRAGDTVEIISLPWRNYAQHLLDNLSRELGERLLNARLDVMLQDELNHPSLFWLNRRMRERISYPLVSIVHHLRSSERYPGWQKRLYRAVERRYFATLDGIIFNSQTTRLAVSHLGVRLEGIPHLVAYPAGNHIEVPFSEADIRERSAEFGPLRLLYVGNVIPRKGLLLILKALTGIQPDSWTLKVVGSLETDWRYSKLVKHQVAESGLEVRVELLGSLIGTDLIEVFKSSQVLVLPSYYEGYGIAYLEGMAFGLPAVATTQGAAGEIITHGQNGFLITPGSIVELREVLQKLVTDRASLLQMSMAARARYLEQPTWEQSDRDIRKFLNSLILERQ
jgi:glycosyltransferase involved in cell wall biosynthesis